MSQLAKSQRRQDTLWQECTGSIRRVSMQDALLFLRPEWKKGVILLLRKYGIVLNFSMQHTYFENFQNNVQYFSLIFEFFAFSFVVIKK